MKGSALSFFSVPQSNKVLELYLEKRGADSLAA